MCITYKIVYTITDEAPAISSVSLLPIISTFINQCVCIKIEICNISLSHRILASFPENLNINQKVNDTLLYLNNILYTPDANIIKLPNISASLLQLNAAITELQSQGFNIPPYINVPQNPWEHEVKCRYNKIQGSAVNPILRAGNSYRYIPLLVKQRIKNYSICYKKKYVWSQTSKTHVSSMKYGDFYNTEKSILINSQHKIKIVLIQDNGTQKILKENITVNKKDIIDASIMSKKALVKFINQEIEKTKMEDILLSVHLKSSMMKISDPIIFGIIVKEFYKKIFFKYDRYIKTLNINFNNGMSEFYQNIEHLPQDIRQSIHQDIDILYTHQPKLAMVDYIKKITNLHLPNGMIIDSSMSIMIRDAGKMWSADGKLYDTNAIIPDSCYSDIYQTIIENCKKYGDFNPKTIGSISNIGLMAESAEEYGSHDNTFQIPSYGRIVRVIDSYDQVLIEHFVEPGDIWRLCYTSDKSIQDWIKLGVEESIKTNIPAIFWLDSLRAHDVHLIKKIKFYLKHLDCNIIKSHIKIMSLQDAMLTSLNHIRAGNNIISITGNVLRDYLTDLFPILELGTSANMLSIISLAAGGKLFETGSGGSAPKHVQQFIQENHLRWNSLGEFLALSASLRHIAVSKNCNIAKILFLSLDKAIIMLLDNCKIPSRTAGQLDTRSSHFYLAQYWAESLAFYTVNKTLKNKFSKLASALIINENKIIDELNSAQGQHLNIGGYYHPNIEKMNAIMRPSITLNTILTEITK